MNYMNRRNRSFWIGLSNQDEGKKWMWIDSTIDYQSQTFRFWAKGAPSNHTNRCALYQLRTEQNLKTWYELPCDFKPTCGENGCLGHICKREVPDKTGK